MKHIDHLAQNSTLEHTAHADPRSSVLRFQFKSRIILNSANICICTAIFLKMSVFHIVQLITLYEKVRIPVMYIQ